MSDDHGSDEIYRDTAGSGGPPWDMAAGYPLTGDRAAMLGNVAHDDSGAWRRLREVAAVLSGHLHRGEFACGTWGRNSNPLEENRGFAGGMQLVGLPHTDRLLLGLAIDYQAGTGYHLAVEA